MLRCLALLITFVSSAHAGGPAKKKTQFLPCCAHPLFSPTRPREWPKPLPLPNGRLLITAGDTLYMLASDGSVIWRTQTPESTLLPAQPVFNEQLGEIGLIGLDGLFFRLEAQTGRLIFGYRMNGKAEYRQILRYARLYLTVVDMSPYSDRQYVSPDKLTCWATDESSPVPLWEIDFPRRATAAVQDGRILAISNTSKGVEIRQIQVPSVAAGRFRE